MDYFNEADYPNGIGGLLWSIINRVRLSPVEYLYAIDVRGNIIFHKTGHVTGVNISDRTRHMFRERAYAIVHNHPMDCDRGIYTKNHPVSFGDLLHMAETQARVELVVAQDYAYEVRHPPYWSDEELDNVYNLYFMSLFGFETREHELRRMRSLAKKYGWTYRVLRLY